MLRVLAVLILIIGVAFLGTAMLFLPAENGRFSYLIEIAIQNDSQESVPEELAPFGALRAVKMISPDPTGQPRQVLMLTDLPSYLKTTDCAIGTLPRETMMEALAGFNSGIGGNTVELAGQNLAICGQLQMLGPIFDDSLVMELSQPIRESLASAGWGERVSYLIPLTRWMDQQRVIHELRQRSELLPTGATFTAYGERPLVTANVQIIFAWIAIIIGFALLYWAFKGMRLAQLRARFNREQV